MALVIAALCTFVAACEGDGAGKQVGAGPRKHRLAASTWGTIPTTTTPDAPSTTVHDHGQGTTTAAPTSTTGAGPTSTTRAGTTAPTTTRAAGTTTTARAATPTTTAPPTSTTRVAPITVGPLYAETFSGAPTTPQPWKPSTWDLTVHSRDTSTWTTLEPMNAGHGHDCAGPPATHNVTSYDDAVFLCRDHVMTAINAGGYGVIYMTPPSQVDFASGEAVIRFDMSTLRTSGRDWVDLWISPYEDQLQMPLESFYPDLNGPPRRGIHVVMNTVNGKTVFNAEVYRNFVATQLSASSQVPYENVLTPSASTRSTFELRISKDRLVFGMPAHDLWWVDSSTGGLDWSRGVVQLGHHSYNPSKDCGVANTPGPDGKCTANTWHWDNVTIAPSVPFTIIRADKRTAVAGSSSVTLAAPAPQGANLRFAGIGSKLQVSFNGGSTWVDAKQQAQEKTSAEEHIRSYWMPIPAGTRTVQFRGADWWGGSWMFRDITVWAK